MQAMQMWQYHIVNLIHSTGDNSFEALGRAGWELVAVDNGKAYYKRPLVEHVAAAEPAADQREPILAGERITAGMGIVLIDGKYWPATSTNLENTLARAPWVGAYAKNDAEIGEPVEMTTGFDVEFMKQHYKPLAETP